MILQQFLCVCKFFSAMFEECIRVTRVQLLCTTFVGFYIFTDRRLKYIYIYIKKLAFALNVRKSNS